jgi:hypothetical protein
LCLDLDATLVIAHSDDKDGAGKTYKRTWGFHPMTAWLDRGDGTGEALAIELRRGNAGANNAADQIAILDRALAQLPELPDELEVLVRADTAGAVHGLVDHIRQWPDAGSRSGCRSPGRSHRDPRPGRARRPLGQRSARTAHPRKGAAVAEITDLVDLSAWPTGHG